jgi:hypothetical protein
MNHSWQYNSGFNAFISGKKLESLKYWEQRQGWKDAKARFVDCVHKPVNEVAFGDIVHYSKKNCSTKFFKVLNNLSISEHSQKLFFADADPEADAAIEPLTAIFRKTTLVLIRNNVSSAVAAKSIKK